MHTCLDWASCYKNKRCRRSPWGPPNNDLPVGFSLACHPCRLRRSSQFDVQTSCSWASDTLLMRSWDRTTSLYNRISLGWWQMKFSPSQPHPTWSGCNQRMHPRSSIAGALPLSPPGCQSMGVGSCLWGRPCLGSWSLHTSSTFC